MAKTSGDPSGGGTQSIERAISLLLLVGRAGTDGIRLSDLVTRSGLPKPTARRVLLALVRAGLLDQDDVTRRYHIGPETYVLGTLASERFGIHALSLDSLSRLAQESGDTAFLSVPRDASVVCLHREEGPFPIRTHVLNAGDRHPMGIGAGSLAILAALPDAEIDRIFAANADILARDYPAYSEDLLRRCVADTRSRGYALNPGILMPGSWGIGLPVMGLDGTPVGALSIAAIESRLGEERRRELVPLLRRETQALEAALRRPSPRQDTQSPSPRARIAAPRTALKVKS
ncbi:transcriptional regulator [Azorhizobium caulinodans ORS 571]|uniref:Transcriptional regulator n=1 Tax=Azorhizobium caulinodans (strain ATCC 43989 / DSM 5975 / JCM 20966 / LMG 6465 / NBRC 14845 / NCIMB 13405 / ORS 571) TaxID=438753 RepID=A8HZ41_AZOC5|nr:MULTISPECIES: IclR family transcriptional regulator [Azorhizobium]TDT91244.1 IclR family transcriptional regulator [Azorhizobium sp. AG788]BAF90532.1 transcriptional regulator [Azorhizobium caulinodans ORS 571]